jgi:hypothetical protein
MRTNGKNLMKNSTPMQNKEKRFMETNTKLNLPIIRRTSEIALKQTENTISKFDLSKKTSIASIMKSESISVSQSILEKEKGLDLVLVGDLTASMTDYHKLLKDKFRELCKELFSMIENLRISIIFYLDHDNHLPYLTKVSKLTKDIEQLYHFIETTTVSLEGNSTFDEAVEDALNDVVNLNWREIGNRSVVLFGDASPHPAKNCPNRFDFFDITERLFKQSITINSVFCGNFHGDLQKKQDCSYGNFDKKFDYLPPEQFFSWIANVTGGMVIGIERIDDLVDIIMAAAAKDSGHLDDLETKLKRTAPNKLKLIDIAKKAELRKMLGNSNDKKLLK